MTGSFGSLGVIVAATFKLYPLTAASRTLIVEMPAAADLGTPRWPDTFEPPDADRTRVCHPSAAPARPLRIDRGVGGAAMRDGAKLIAESRLYGEDGIRVRRRSALGGTREVSAEPIEARCSKSASCRRSSPGTLDLIDRLAGKSGYVAAGRAGFGVFLLRIPDDVQLQKRVIEGLRDCASGLAGAAPCVVQGSPQLKAACRCLGTDRGRTAVDAGREEAVRSRAACSVPAAGPAGCRSKRNRKNEYSLHPLGEPGAFGGMLPIRSGHFAAQPRCRKYLSRDCRCSPGRTRRAAAASSRGRLPRTSFPARPICRRRRRAPR